MFDAAAEVELVSIALRIFLSCLPLLRVDQHARNIVVDHARTQLIIDVVDAIRTCIGSSLPRARVLYKELWIISQPQPDAFLGW